MFGKFLSVANDRDKFSKITQLEQLKIMDAIVNTFC